MLDLYNRMNELLLGGMDDESLDIVCDVEKATASILEMAEEDSAFKEMLVIAGAIEVAKKSAKHGLDERERRAKKKAAEEAAKAEKKVKKEDEKVEESLAGILKMLFN